MNQAKENILERIREGKQKANLWNSVSEPKTNNFFVKSENNLIETFKISIEKINGQFFPVNNELELKEVITNLFSNQDIICKDGELQSLLSTLKINFSSTIDKNSNPLGFIKCEYLVARLGSVLTSSALESGRELNIFPEHQIVLANKNQLVYDIENAIEGIKIKYPTLPSMISFATGPSRTADIEKTLILGAHGPKLLTIIYKNY